VIAVYSTFLQRAYDQLIEDVALQNAGVVLAVDRAGIVGEDGATHQGLFDIAFLRSIPNFIVMAPKDGDELRAMLEFALNLNAPVAIRYPKGKAPGPRPQAQKIELGKAELLKEGKDLAIIALGSMVGPAEEAAGLLEDENLSATVINARFVKPLDKNLFEAVRKKVKHIFTIEEGVVSGGFGSAVSEALDAPVIRIGLPCEFIPHGKRDMLLEKYGLTARGIVERIKMSYA
jgi:1-deoxy-D-xylulose-5-phosphate synthase